jgi:hypothetical protein
MATTDLKNVISPGCGTTETTLLTTTTTKYAVILSFNIANVTEDAIQVSARVLDIDSSATVWLFKNIEILPGCSLIACGGEQKFNLYYQQSLLITVDTDNSADVLLSYSEITP